MFFGVEVSQEVLAEASVVHQGFLVDHQHLLRLLITRCWLPGVIHGNKSRLSQATQQLEKAADADEIFTTVGFGQ